MRLVVVVVMVVMVFLDNPGWNRRWLFTEEFGRDDAAVLNLAADAFAVTGLAIREVEVADFVKAGSPAVDVYSRVGRNHVAPRLLCTGLAVYDAAPVNADNSHDPASGVVPKFQTVMLATPTLDEGQTFMAVFWDLGQAAIRRNRD